MNIDGHIIKDVEYDKVFYKEKDSHGCDNICIIGSTQGGKTTKIKAIIKHKAHYFDNVMIISKTADLSPNTGYKNIVPDSCIYDYYPSDKIHKIYSYQKKIFDNFHKEKAKGNPNPPISRTLIVLDDCMVMLSDILKDKIFQEIFYSGRHIGIKVILCVQDLKSITKKIRHQISIAIFLNVDTHDSIRTVSEEFWSQKYGNNKFCAKIYSDITGESKSAVVVDTLNKGADISDYIYKFRVPENIIETLSDFKIGSQLLWATHQKYYDTNWTENSEDKKMNLLKQLHK